RRSSMDRLACVDLPAFPLQLLLAREPAWRDLPTAVVEEARPRGRVLWVNERARRSGILPGHRYAQAAALTPELRAAPVSMAEIGASSRQLTETLRRFTPDVEPIFEGALGDSSGAGTFFLSGAGLGKLIGSASAWGRS